MFCFNLLLATVLGIPHGCDSERDILGAGHGSLSFDGFVISRRACMIEVYIDSNFMECS